MPNIQKTGNESGQTDLDIGKTDWPGRTRKDSMNHKKMSDQTNIGFAALIVNWNSLALLRGCLHCLLNQEIVVPDVFVLDNGGQEPIPDEIIADFPAVRFFKSESNLGFAGGNNYLFERTRSYPWIALVNPDAFLRADWFCVMHRAIDAHPGFSWFASRLIQANRRDTLDGEGDALHVSGLAWRVRNGSPVNGGAKKSTEVFSACAAAALYSRAALDASGTFDENFFCYFEDVDLGFRLRLAGYRCLLVPQAVAYHVGSASVGRHSDFAVYHGHRNLVWTYVKNMPGALFWIFLPAHLMLNFISVVWFFMMGKGRLILQAKKDALQGLPHMWEKRRRIQKQRCVSVWDIWKILDKSPLPRLNKMW